jgi:transposase-like protein
MAKEVNLVGSRVSMMHVAYDCPRCTKTTTVTITEGGKDASGRQRLEQRPPDCPECGMAIALSLVTETSGDGHPVR